MYSHRELLSHREVRWRRHRDDGWGKTSAKSLNHPVPIKNKLPDVIDGGRKKEGLRVR